MATLNQWIATALFGLGVVVAAIGLYLGFFAWLNDGPTAGIRLGLTAGVFALALAAGGLVFRIASAAHARGDPRRWWVQVGVVFAAWFAAALAAWASSMVDRLFPPT